MTFKIQLTDDSVNGLAWSKDGTASKTSVGDFEIRVWSTNSQETNYKEVVKAARAGEFLESYSVLYDQFGKTHTILVTRGH
ncbi:hypothetical protein BGZ97_009175, partial [Linnemannia gamsii]